jgi:hypothetical protein
VALLTLIFLLFGFAFLGVGGGSTSVKDLNSHHSAKCSARMGSGESLRDCGGPPANP